MINTIRETFNSILSISKLINVPKKKIKILFSVLLSNIVVVIDIGIIYLFTSFFQVVELPSLLSQIDVESLAIYLPVLVFLRFMVIYLDTMNIHTLRLGIEKQLRLNFLDEVYTRGNFTLSDSYFFINTLCVHVATFYQNLAMLFTTLVKITLFLVFLLFSNISVIGYFAVGFILLIVPSRYFTKLNRKYSHSSYISSHNISDNVERVIDNLYLIKILKKFKFERSNFSKNLDEYYGSQINNQKYGALNSLFPTSITMLLMSLFLIYSDSSTLLTLDVIAIILRLFQSLGEFNRVYSISISTFVHLKNFEDIEINKEKVYSDNFKITDNDSVGLVHLENVSFKYLNSDQYVFKDLDLKILKNTHTIITGPNGVGKSTFLGLISGVFYPENGQVNLQTRNVSYVSAYPMILRGSLRENVLYGVSTSVHDTKIENLLSDFELFQNKAINLDTEISNKSLSSGQMQKVSFIRALLSEPELLLLDESTANLDIETKNMIYSILENLDLTIINSTHSSDNFKNYDIEYSFKVVNGVTQITKKKSR